MFYATTYWLEPTPAPLEFDSAVATEYGRVRSVCFIRRDYLAAVQAAPTDLTVWETGVEEGKILVLPLTNGSFDSGKMVKLRGYGRRLSTHAYRDMVLSVTFSPNLVNQAFMNEVERRTDLVPAFRTGSYLYLMDRPADIVTQERVEDDLESRIEWTMECTVRSRNLPDRYPAESLLELFTCRPSTCVMQDFTDDLTCEFT